MRIVQCSSPALRLVVTQGSLFGESRRSHVQRYMTALDSKNSRRVQYSALRSVARLVNGDSATPELFDWAALDKDAVMDLRIALIDKYPPETARHYLSAAKSVCWHAWDAGDMSAETLQRIRSVPRIKGKSVPRARSLDRPEVRKVVRRCAGTNTPIGIRDAAIVAFFYFTGVRRAELAGIQMSDIDLGRGLARVTGKGNKQRYVGCFQKGTGSRKVLAQWLAVRGLGCGPLFRRVYRSSVKPQGLSGNRIWRIIRDRMAELQLAHASPHDLRRTFATHLTRAGVDLALLADMMGHEDISTTRIYVKRNLDEQQRAARKIDW